MEDRGEEGKEAEDSRRIRRRRIGRRRRRRRRRRRTRRWYSSGAPRSSGETISPATRRRRAAPLERSPAPRVMSPTISISTTRRPRSGLRGTRLTPVQAGSRRNQSTPIDVYDHSREHESGARQDSKRRATPTMSLTLTPMCQVPSLDLRGQAYRVPGSRNVFTSDVIGATTN